MVFPFLCWETEIELTVDKGKVEVGRQSAPLCELELGLKRGETAELFKLARVLAEEVPVQLAVKSEAERGYALVAGEEPQAVKAAPVALTPEDRKSTRLNSSHLGISYAVFCLKKKK